MKTQKIIKLPKGKYIAQIEPFMTDGLYSDSLYHKGITGCGITRYAIEFFKHNIIGILPNVPVIQAKVAKQNEDHPDEQVLGVYKGVSVAKIKVYLLSDAPYKKILTTPEGFIKKVLKAFNDINELYQNFFLLYDECDRIITDVSYRGAMAAPLDTFFDFKKKAMVSATTLPFSDERFDGFTHYIIEPQYDYSKNITLITTNNVVESLKEYLDSLQSEHICVFFNSTKGIYNIIKHLGIADESSVFCSEDSIVKLLEYGYADATEDFVIEKMSKYNFFTSRYFSAFDIELAYLPDVIMLTDVFFADHSILDPHTEVIQIAGRFRNGLNSLAHITNFNMKLNAKSESEARMYLEGCFDTYDGFVKDFNKATNPGKRDTLKQAYTNSHAHSYYLDGKVNMFMVDNFIHEERVKGYYQHASRLREAYASRPKHFNVTYKGDAFRLTDEDLFDLNSTPNKKDKYKIVANILYKYKPKPGLHLIIGKPESLLDKLEEKYKDIALGVRYLDKAVMDDTDYVISEIRKQVDLVKEALELERVSHYVYQFINPFNTVPSSEIASSIKAAYTKAKTDMKPKAQDVLLFFSARRTTEKKKNVFVLEERLYPIQE